MFSNAVSHISNSNRSCFRSDDDNDNGDDDDDDDDDDKDDDDDGDDNAVAFTCLLTYIIEQSENIKKKNVIIEC